VLAIRALSFCIALGAVIFSAVVARAATGTLRIVSYNTDQADQNSEDNLTAAWAGMPTVFQAIGQHYIGTNAQPIDVMGVEELNPSTGTQDGATTLGDMVTALNNIYGAGTYAYYSFVDANTGGGAGPDGLVYNTNSVQIISATTLAFGTSGAARAPIRYQIRPAGYGSDADFYMYVSHYKAGSDSSSLSRRNVEATEIRTDAATLGANAHIIYSGDFNMTGGSNEAAWATLTAAGTGQAIDPTGATGWVGNSDTWKYLYSESTDSLGGRFDMQLVSSAMLNQPGLQLAPDTSDPFTGGFPSSKYPYAYEIFGNNGTTPRNGATNDAGNTSLADLANASTVLNDLMQFDNDGNFVGSDHLPCVADYVLTGVSPVPEPSSWLLVIIGGACSVLRIKKSFRRPAGNRIQMA
jgi:hypothetical protein